VQRGSPIATPWARGFASPRAGPRKSETGGGSYFSQSDLRANFGLGKSETIDLVEVIWPGGTKQSFHNVVAEKFYQISESSDSLSLQKISGCP